MAVGEVGSAISQRLLLPRDLCLPWVVACRAWKSRGHLSAMGTAAARSVLPSLAGHGRVWHLPAKVWEAKVCLVAMGNAWEGGGPAESLLPDRGAPRQGRHSGSVSSQLRVGVACASV